MIREKVPRFRAGNYITFLHGHEGVRTLFVNMSSRGIIESILLEREQRECFVDFEKRVSKWLETKSAHS